jgi:hypothetical protein
VSVSAAAAILKRARSFISFLVYVSERALVAR